MVLEIRGIEIYEHPLIISARLFLPSLFRTFLVERSNAFPQDRNDKLHNFSLECFYPLKRQNAARALEWLCIYSEKKARLSRGEILKILKRKYGWKVIDRQSQSYSRVRRI